MANTLRKLDPQASPAALFGAEVRVLRLGRGLSLAALGKQVHVSGDLIGKIEKAERHPQPDLVERLDTALQAGGHIRDLGYELRGCPAETAATVPDLAPDSALPRLRQVVDEARATDHEMSERAPADQVLAHATAAERLIGRVGRADRYALGKVIAEAYQLAGWMSFDAGHTERATSLFTTSRHWADRAHEPALTAFVLGPNLSFAATYGGQAGLGLELAYGAWGWARRSGNDRLAAFTLAIGARAHARLGDTTLCLDLLDQAESALARHQPDGDPRWLDVFDQAALNGHRGSCLRDLGQPRRALAPLADQEIHADPRFRRNHVIWQLDNVDALLDLAAIEQAGDRLTALLSSLTGAATTPRVRRRFHAVELRLRALHPTPTIRAALDQLRPVSAVRA